MVEKDAGYEVQAKSGSIRGKTFSLLAGVGMAALCIGVAWLCHSWGDLAFFLMVYLLGAVVVAWRWGRLAAGVVAILGMLGHDLLFKTHSFRFSSSIGSQFIVFLGLIGIAQLVADLVQKLREQTRMAMARERETASLYALSRLLADESSSEGLMKAGEAFLSSELRSPVSIRGADLHHEEGDGRLPVPLESSKAAMGTLLMDEATWNGTPQTFREACVRQISLALERALSNEEAERARAEADRERTCNSLLSAVSHDFRTPLAAIRGAASTLASDEEELSPEERREMVEMIQEESQRLDRLLSNLLDLTRLEHGDFGLEREWQPLEEVVGATLTRLEAALGALPVQVELPEHLPPVPIDGALVELLLLNLIENALRHAPGSDVRLSARTLPGEVLVEVTDLGPGVPEVDRERIFEKFTRREGAMRDGGLGLGLAICRAITRIHGGRIWVEEADGGGAAFRFTLPCEGAPSLLSL